MQLHISSEKSAILQTLLYINAHEHSIAITRMELYNNGASVLDITMCCDLKKNTKQIEFHLKALLFFNRSIWKRVFI